jgi:hypothetical protein
MSEDDKDERFYRDTEAIASPKLDDWQLALLEPLGHRRMLRRGELVFKAGQRDLGLAVVLSGEVEAFEAPTGLRKSRVRQSRAVLSATWRCSTAPLPWRASGVKPRNRRFSKSQPQN